MELSEFLHRGVLTLFTDGVFYLAYTVLLFSLAREMPTFY